MGILSSLILTLAITAGQLIRLPVGSHSGANLLDISVLFLCLLGLWKLKARLKQPPLFVKSALLFILFALFSLMLTPLHLQPVEYLISFLYTVRFSLYILLGWLICSGAFPFLRNNIPRILIFSGLSVAVLGLIQFVFLPDLRFLTREGWDPHYFRTVSTFLDPNFAGAFFVLTLLLLVSISYLGGRTLLTPGVFYLIFTTVYLALLTTFSRSSYLMFLVSGLTFSFLKRSKTFFFATVMLFAPLLIGFQVYTHLVAEPRNIDREQSASFRLNTWQQGYQLFQKSPVLGIGYNAYRYGIARYKLGDKQFLESHGSSSNDSSLLFVASTTGILGLLAYLYFLWTLLKPSNGTSLALTVGLAGLLVQSFFANSLFYPPILAWILLISSSPKK